MRHRHYSMDILGSYECVCTSCLKSLRERKLDPLVRADRKANDKAVLMAFFERFSREVNGAFPEVRIFYNSGHIFKGQRERYRFYGQLELEKPADGRLGVRSLSRDWRAMRTAWACRCWV